MQKTSDANEVETADLAKAEVEKIRAELPPGMTLYISQDFSTFTKGARDDTVSNILIGIVLTALILLFFLHDIRSTIIVSLSMPVAIITTFIFMSVSGFSLNMLSLMAISVSVGILVTNSIVVIENIYRHAQMGEGMKEASVTGATEIAIAVAATTLTNVVVFLPVANMSGIIGGIFKEFGLTVTYATIISLLTSFTLTPMLSAYLLKIEKVRRLADIKNLKGIQALIEGFLKGLENIYHRTLNWIIGKKGKEAIIILLTVVALVFSLALFPLIGGEFMPNVDQGDLRILIDMPTNYDLTRTQKVAEKIENRVKEYDFVESITTTIGTQGGLDQGQNLAQISIKLVPNDQRDISSRQFSTKLRRQMADIPDATLKISAVSRMGGGPGEAIELQVMGQEMDQVIEYADQIVERAKQVPGAINVSSDYKAGKPELRIVPDRIKMADLGVSASQVAMEIRAALEGFVSSRYRESGYEYDIIVKLADSDKSSPEMIGQLPIATPRGFVPLEQIAHIDYTTASTKLTRIDKFSNVSVSMGTEGRTTGEVLADVMAEVEKMNLPGGYKVQVGGQARMMQESFASMIQALILALILTYMLLVSILESFLQPFIIFFTIPLSLVGIMLSLFLTGNSFNMISMMSIIMLVGIVVNNAILLIDYINTLRSKGINRRQAIVDACPVKLKPILMATIAIALGMLPLALGIGSDGVEMRQGMGIVTIGGLMSSAIFTMYVIPILYRWMSPKDEEA